MDVLHQHLEERPTAERSPTKLGEAVGLSRATIWRQLRKPSTTRNDELELRSQIQTIALEMRTYGYRPITAELHRHVASKSIASAFCGCCVKTTCSVCGSARLCALLTRVTT
jgi:hypothetical protein